VGSQRRPVLVCNHDTWDSTQRHMMRRRRFTDEAGLVATTTRCPSTRQGLPDDGRGVLGCRHQSHGRLSGWLCQSVSGLWVQNTATLMRCGLHAHFAATLPAATLMRCRLQAPSAPAGCVARSGLGCGGL
jgi:hypothetical protein